MPNSIGPPGTGSRADRAGQQLFPVSAQPVRVLSRSAMLFQASAIQRAISKSRRFGKIIDFRLRTRNHSTGVMHLPAVPDGRFS